MRVPWTVLRGTLGFALGVWAAALLWRTPGRPQGQAREAPAMPASNRQSSAEIVSLEEILRNLQSEDSLARLSALERLARVPLAQVREQLERVPLKEEGRLTQAARALLIRWASVEGEAAASWAWERFAGSPFWERAYRELGAAWAWHRPQEFRRWVEARKPPPSLNLLESGEGDGPPPRLSLRMIAWSGAWLAAEDPAGAFLLLKGLPGVSSDSAPAVARLRSVDQVEEAIRALEPFDPLEPGRWRGDQMLLRGLLLRWQELDRDSFVLCPYAIVSGLAEPQPAELAEALRQAPAADRAATADRLAEEGAPSRRGNRLHAILSEWTSCDPEAAGEWVLARGEPGWQAHYAGKLAATDLPGALHWIERLPAPAQAGAVVAAFRAADPGGASPDLNGCPPSMRQLWEDLAVLNGRR